MDTTAEIVSMRVAKQETERESTRVEGIEEVLMIPSWLDLQGQAEFNRERAEKAAKTNHILRIQREAKGRSSGHRIVQFGVWLEQIGCKLQSRYATPTGLNVCMTSVNDTSLQSC